MKNTNKGIYLIVGSILGAGAVILQNLGNMIYLKDRHSQLIHDTKNKEELINRVDDQEVKNIRNSVNEKNGGDNNLINIKDEEIKEMLGDLKMKNEDREQMLNDLNEIRKKNIRD
jgi:hypothetical protein